MLHFIIPGLLSVQKLGRYPESNTQLHSVHTQASTPWMSPTQIWHEAHLTLQCGSLWDISNTIRPKLNSFPSLWSLFLTPTSTSGKPVTGDPHTSMSYIRKSSPPYLKSRCRRQPSLLPSQAFWSSHQKHTSELLQSPPRWFSCFQAHHHHHHLWSVLHPATRGSLVRSPPSALSYP